MTHIKIEWLDDQHDCDTCGLSWADGAYIKFDDGRELELIPSSYCFGSDHWFDYQVIGEIIRFIHMGEKYAFEYDKDSGLINKIIIESGVQVYSFDIFNDGTLSDYDSLLNCLFTLGYITVED